MGNAKTDHSKALRAAAATKSMRKRLQNPAYKQLRLAGDIEVINQFIAHLEATGEMQRIDQLAAINKILAEAG